MFFLLGTFVALFALLLLSIVSPSPACADGYRPVGIPADEALARLKEGNAHFMHAVTNSGDMSPTKRDSLYEAQYPYAVIVSCSDSRVVPEDIFSVGLGELFVIRVAGNVVDDHALGSVEYATAHLGSNLVVVIGHEHCGAVGAALSGHTHGYITSITDSIKEGIGDEHDARQASIANARHVAQVIRERLGFDDGGSIKVVSAYYELHGKVEFFEDK